MSSLSVWKFFYLQYNISLCPYFVASVSFLFVPRCYRMVDYTQCQFDIINKL